MKEVDKYQLKDTILDQFMYIREKSGVKQYLAIMNFGHKLVIYDLSNPLNIQIFKEFTQYTSIYRIKKLYKKTEDVEDKLYFLIFDSVQGLIVCDFSSEPDLINILDDNNPEVGFLTDITAVKV